uniref:ATP synthase complex subunit 8 n=1 Tax=Triops longicaudatus TaxID=58777 RepID=E3TAG1_9CRUS|nr:ATP synthase F0 subunit 8 [Triops longicaudatus]AJD07277.1 ATP synthase F0 subunit 8 [Triops longicaudatus]AJD07290.1 ATP synthase F0 subunit 8 [Triops longicaudatus]WQM56355.1 ATP synthase F0 subunit 8 [Triops longicaudatus]
MAPTNWLILFILFTAIFLIFINFLYFHSFTADINQDVQKKNTNSLNWKW